MDLDGAAGRGRGFQTAEQHVYEYLRDCILAGRLRGGERINQDETARRLGVSRMPVREAIKRLDSAGFVMNRPHRGAVVTALGPEAMLELFEMRSVLEGLAVALAIPALDDHVIADLEERARRMREAQSAPARWVDLHDDFHDVICRLAPRPRLVAYIANLRQSVAPYLRLYLSAYTEAEMVGFEHMTLIDAIKHRDPRIAETTMREHVLSAASGVVEFLRQSGPECSKVTGRRS
jgi:DNA-binding GntR family transcriptional regulator